MKKYLWFLLVCLNATLLAKTILVTGGAGVIGSCLCEDLLSNGHRVICIDNFLSSSRKSIQKLEKNENFLLIVQDVCEPLKLSEDIDEIYHLACPASPIHYQKKPVVTLRTSFTGTLNMLELARKKRAKLLFSSTSEVYGDPLEHPQNEEYWGNVNPIGLRACYDEGKRVAEALIISYRKQFEVDGKIARIFNTYGPNMHRNDGRVISNFIDQALNGRPITIYGDGSQTRSFCFVSDTVKGLKKLMATQSEFSGPVNIGNPNEMTIEKVARKIVKMTKSTSKIVYGPLPKDDPKMRKPDISRAMKELHWKPDVDFDKGLEMTIAFFLQS